MTKKLLAVFMAMIMVLGCTVMAGAEEVPADEYANDPVLSTMDAEMLDEVKEAVIATLPEEEKDKEYVLSSNGDATGESISLISTEVAMPVEVQEMIDNGELTPEDAQAPEGVEVTICTSEILTPYIENEDGEMENAFVVLSAPSGVNTYSSWYNISGGGYVASVRLRYTRYAGLGEVAVRPLSISGYYTRTNTSAALPAVMKLSVGIDGSTYTYPGAFTDPDNSLVSIYGFYYSNDISEPTEGTTYSSNPGINPSHCVVVSTIDLGNWLRNGNNVDIGGGSIPITY